MFPVCFRVCFEVSFGYVSECWALDEWDVVGVRIGVCIGYVLRYVSGGGGYVSGTFRSAGLLTKGRCSGMYRGMYQRGQTCSFS